MYLSFTKEDNQIISLPIKGIACDYIPNPKQPKMLLIHGAHAASAMFYPLMKRLHDQGFEVWAINLRGHGESPPFPINKAHIRDYVEDVTTVCNDIKPDVLIGHSLGGLIAQKVATQITFKGLILLSSVPPKGVSWHYHNFTKILLLSIPLIGKYIFRKPIPTLPRVNKYFAFSSTPKAVINCFITQTAAYNIAFLESPLLPFDIAFTKQGRVDAKAITCPIMVASGTHDKLISVKTQKDLALYLNTTFTELPNSGHMVMMEKDLDTLVSHIAHFMA